MRLREIGLLLDYGEIGPISCLKALLCCIEQPGLQFSRFHSSIGSALGCVERSDCVPHFCGDLGLELRHSQSFLLQKRSIGAQVRLRYTVLYWQGELQSGFIDYGRASASGRDRIQNSVSCQRIAADSRQSWNDNASGFVGPIDVELRLCRIGGARYLPRTRLVRN